MKIIWKITETDIKKVKQYVADNENPFVQQRRERNVKRKNIIIDKDAVIYTMLMCLLTSQQRSGPNSAVGQFLSKKQFPVTFNKLKTVDNVEHFLRGVLKDNGLTRYINNISEYFSNNFKLLQGEKWSLINELKDLLLKDSKNEERMLADKLAEKHKGFGPKQARNFLQAIGLTKYEIPVDSRITKWLSDFGFPVTFSSTSLSDKGYYHLVLDGIQELCDKAKIYPCILDAVIFSSYDNDQWTKDSMIY